MKLIFESLNDNKLKNINEGDTVNIIKSILSGTLEGISELAKETLDSLLKAIGVKKDKVDNRKIRVLKSIAKIVDSNPKVTYNSDFDLGQYIMMGVVDTDSMKKYINKFKSELMKNTKNEISNMSSYIDDSNSYSTLVKTKALFIIADGFGNSQWITLNGDVYDWDHETHEVKKIGKYEDLIIKELDYIEYLLKGKGLLIED